MIYTVTLNPAVDRELSVSQLAYDTVLRALSGRIDFGGKGFNVSRMVCSLGADTCALGFVGGKNGEILQEGLTSLGIETNFVWVEDETRTNISIVTTQHDHYIKVNEPGPEISLERQAELMTRIGMLVHAGDWWVLAGSLPPGVGETIYGEMITLIEAGGAHTILDTSGKALGHGCRAGAYLVKPNGYEAELLTGVTVTTPTDAIKAAACIQEMGVKVVIISLGRQGAVLHTEGQSWLATSPAVQEKNPIGAGDSLVGGAVWALSQGFAVQAALRWGVACGAAAASMEGTALGNQALIQSLHDQIVIQRFA